MDATQTPEDWRPIPGLEGHYEASSLGRIRSLKRATPYVLKPQWTDVTDSYGRYTLTLSMSGQRRTHCLHLLVAEAFHGPRPDGMWACHNNSDPRDNRPENLRWDTPAANHVDMLDAGNHHYSKRTHCKYGHEYTAENTLWHRPLSGDRYVNPNPYRRCRECDRINHRKAKRRKKLQRQ